MTENSEHRMLKLRRVLSGHAGRIFRLSWSPDGSRLASPSQDGTVRIWKAKTGSLELSLHGHEDEVNDAAWSPDGRLLASVGDDHLVVVWDIESGERVHVLKGHRDHVNSACFNEDGRRLISVGDDKRCLVWNIESGENLDELLGHTHAVWTARWKPEGEWFATGADDETIRLWNLSTGERRVLRGHSSTVRTVAWFRNQPWLVSGGRDAAVRIWNIDFPDDHRVLSGHSQLVTSVAVSHEDRYIASKSIDNTVRVWDVPSGETVAVLHEPACGRWSPGLSFSPVTNSLATLGERNTVIRLWRYSTAAAVDSDKRRSTGSKVFISYSHRDEAWLKRLMIMLEPLRREGLFSLWADDKIETGDRWREQISHALDESAVAVLLVTPEFLASDFIREMELPTLLKRAESGGLKLLWIPVRESLFEAASLDKYQAACDPNRPLEARAEADQGVVLARVCREIRSHVSRGE